MEFSSLASTLHLLPNWLKRVLEDSEEEGRQQKLYAVKLLPQVGRFAVWNMCSYFKIENNGVPAQACRLFERYLAILYKDNANALNEQEWNIFETNLTMKIPLLIATCIQLVAKNNNSSTNIIPKTVQSVLLLYTDISYSVEEIKRTEFLVYKKLGFRLPFWTGIDIVELLALKVGLKFKNLDLVVQIVNYAEYRRDVINVKVREVTSLLPNRLSISSILTLHLTAGALLTCYRLLNIPEMPTNYRLAQITNAPHAYIKCICDCIYTDIVTKTDESDII